MICLINVNVNNFKIALEEGGEGGVPNPVKRLKMTQISVTLGSKTLKMAQIRVKPLNA